MGQSINLYELLFKPDNSLIHQSYRPYFTANEINLAGCGFCAWNNCSHPEIPFQYLTTNSPLVDRSLKMLTQKIDSGNILAHVRGGFHRNIHMTVNEDNVHPFRYPISPLAFAHNGEIMNFQCHKRDIYQYIAPDVAWHINGNTDSELIFSLLLTLLGKHRSDPTLEQVKDAVIECLEVIGEIIKKKNINEVSPMNFFILWDKQAVLTRYSFNYGNAPLGEWTPKAYTSLWYTYGKSFDNHNSHFQMTYSPDIRSIIFASEPLTKRHNTWIEVPEYSLVTLEQHEEAGPIDLNFYDLD